MDDGSLLKVLNNARSVNSQLMKTNLGLLMSIRETDCQIQRAKEQLQKYHALLQGRGLTIGTACDSAVTNAPNNNTKEHTNSDRGNEASANDEDNDDDDDQNTDSSSDSSADE